MTVIIAALTDSATGASIIVDKTDDPINAAPSLRRELSPAVPLPLAVAASGNVDAFATGRVTDSGIRGHHGAAGAAFAAAIAFESTPRLLTPEGVTISYAATVPHADTDIFITTLAATAASPALGADNAVVLTAMAAALSISPGALAVSVDAASAHVAATPTPAAPAAAAGLSAGAIAGIAIAIVVVGVGILTVGAIVLRRRSLKAHARIIAADDGSMQGRSMHERQSTIMHNVTTPTPSSKGGPSVFIV